MILYNKYETYLIKITQCLKLCSIPGKDKQPLYTLLGNRYKDKLPDNSSDMADYYYQLRNVSEFELLHIIISIYNRLRKDTLNKYIDQEITVKVMVDHINREFRYYKGDK